MKKGQSLPNSAANSSNFEMERPSSKSVLIPDNIYAASEDPPPKHQPIGIILRK